MVSTAWRACVRDGQGQAGNEYKYMSFIIFIFLKKETKTKVSVHERSEMVQGSESLQEA